MNKGQNPQPTDLRAEEVRDEHRQDGSQRVMRKYGSDSNSQTRGGVSNIMPLSQSDVKDIRALNLPHVLSRGSSHQVKRVIASHSEYQITSLPLFQAHSNGVVSFQMPKSRSDLSSGHLCFLRFSLCHFCVIFRQKIPQIPVKSCTVPQKCWEFLGQLGTPLPEPLRFPQIPRKSGNSPKYVSRALGENP